MCIILAVPAIVGFLVLFFSISALMAAVNCRMKSSLVVGFLPDSDILFTVDADYAVPVLKVVGFLITLDVLSDISGHGVGSRALWRSWLIALGVLLFRKLWRAPVCSRQELCV